MPRQGLDNTVPREPNANFQSDIVEECWATGSRRGGAIGLYYLQGILVPRIVSLSDIYLLPAPQISLRIYMCQLTAPWLGENHKNLSFYVFWTVSNLPTLTSLVCIPPPTGTAMIDGALNNSCVHCYPIVMHRSTSTRLELI